MVAFEAKTISTQQGTLYAQFFFEAFELKIFLNSLLYSLISLSLSPNSLPLALGVAVLATPLLYAAWCGHEVVVKLLLKKGAELESKDNNG